MDIVKLSDEEIRELEKEKTITLILNRITNWHKPKEVVPSMLADFLFEMFFKK